MVVPRSNDHTAPQRSRLVDLRARVDSQRSLVPAGLLGSVCGLERRLAVDGIRGAPYFAFPSIVPVVGGRNSRSVRSKGSITRRNGAPRLRMEA